MAPSLASTQQSTLRSGLPLGITCHVLWGVLPLYFVQLDFAPTLEIIAHRVVWTLVLCLALLAATRRLPELVAVLRSPKQLAALALAALLIASNWLAYVYASNSGQVLQTSLGYFINPSLTIMLGVLVLRERLRPAQWLAVGVSLIAILIISYGYGHLPWLSLILPITFGLYGLTKKLAGRSVAPIPSLTAETLVLAPPALIILAWLKHTDASHFTLHGARSALLLMSTGIATAVPLTAFAAAARRLPLSVLGMMQYISPILQFGIAVGINHETMLPSSWLGFALIWSALTILTINALYAQQRRRL